MGSGIAQVSAQASLNVVLVDQNEQILQNAKQAMEKSLKRIAKKKFGEDLQAAKAFAEDTLKNVNFIANVPKAVKDADLVIEAIVEKIDAKQKLFAEIEAAVPK
jgi:3-hydroxyacyl-CoA dehydrogenase